MAKKKRTRQQNSTNQVRAVGLLTPKKFTALMSGLEDVYFTWGTTKDAAKG